MIRPALARVLALAIFMAVAALLAPPALAPALANEGRELPPPAHDLAQTDGPQTAVFAGGCFWGVQAVFQHTKGVISATSGYVGGTAETAQYRRVASGQTGHAEAVQVVFDPKQISYGTLLHIFFSVAHDPTQLNRQGPDVGPQYRSALFPSSDEQAGVAKAYIASLNRARVFPAAIVTTLEGDQPFYPAEDDHQNFLARNPTHPYIVQEDLPKIDALQRLFPQNFREDPVLLSLE